MQADLIRQQLMIMKRNYLAIAFILFVFSSCAQQNVGQNYSNSEKISFNLVQLCIDSTLQLDQGLNTTKYLVDFTKVSQLNHQGVNKFFELNRMATTTNLDSMVLHDSTWINYQYFQNAVIRIEKITEQKNGTLLIITSKNKASDGSIGTEIILQKQGEVFKCLSCKITWIS